MLRYAITNRALFRGDDRHRQAALIEQAARWITEGIGLIQLREKDLPAADLVSLARNLLTVLRDADSPAKLLINSRPDVAIAASAHGVHLPAATGELTPAQVRRLYADADRPPPLITVSCHSLDEVTRARDNDVDAVLFAPVFEKSVGGQIVSPGQGIERLSEACAAALPTPVYAMGGVTFDNASLCLQAGAAGVAGIRLYARLG